MFGKYKEKNCAPPRKNIHVVSLQFDNQIGGQKDTCGTPMGQEKILSSAFFFFFFFSFLVVQLPQQTVPCLKFGVPLRPPAILHLPSSRFRLKYLPLFASWKLLRNCMRALYAFVITLWTRRDNILTRQYRFSFRNSLASVVVYAGA
jgi:hypothetical protein